MAMLSQVCESCFHRRFNVLIQGQSALTDFSILEAFGFATTGQKQFAITVTAVSSALDITFVGLVDSFRPSVSAIEVIQISASEPTSTAVPSPTQEAATTSELAAPTTTSEFAADTTTGAISDQEIALFRINAGGSSFTDAVGRKWKTDTDFVKQGEVFSDPSLNIVGTPTPQLYQSERYADTDLDPEAFLRYQFPVANGDFRVVLHFADICLCTLLVGERVFDVSIEEQVLLHNFDIVSDGGWASAVVHEFPITVADGKLTIEISPVTGKQNPKISAIEVFGLASSLPTTTIIDTTTANSAATTTGITDAKTTIPITTTTTMLLSTTTSPTAAVSTGCASFRTCRCKVGTITVDRIDEIGCQSCSCVRTSSSTASTASTAPITTFATTVGTSQTTTAAVTSTDIGPSEDPTTPTLADTTPPTSEAQRSSASTNTSTSTAAHTTDGTITTAAPTTNAAPSTTFTSTTTALPVTVFTTFDFPTSSSTAGSLDTSTHATATTSTTSADETTSAATAAGILYRINCGGGEFIDSAGNKWLQDEFFNTGQTLFIDAPISGTSEQFLYQTERYDEVRTCARTSLLTAAFFPLFPHCSYF